MSGIDVVFMVNLFNTKNFTEQTDEDGFLKMPKVFDETNKFIHCGWKQFFPTIYQPDSYLNVNDFQSKTFWGVWCYNMLFVYPKFTNVDIDKETNESIWEKDPKDEVINITAYKIYNKTQSIPKSSSIRLPPNYESLGWYIYSDSDNKWIQIKDEDSQLMLEDGDYPFWGVYPTNGTVRIRLNYHKKNEFILQSEK